MGAACGKHQLTVDRDGHGYRLDGVPVPSVTRICNVMARPGLEEWKLRRLNWSYLPAGHRLPDLEHEAQLAADYGTSMHAALAMLARGRDSLPLPMPETWVASRRALTEWFAANVLQVLHVEEPVASVRFKFAGRVDLVALLRGHKRPSIIDLKTGNGVWLADRIQVGGGYSLAVEEWLGLKTESAILHCPREEPGTIKPIIRIANPAVERTAFLNALSLYRRIMEVSP